MKITINTNDPAAFDLIAYFYESEHGERGVAMKRALERYGRES